MNRLLQSYILTKYANISFDIFDTIIERDVSNPLDIFSLVENETEEPDFRNRRIQAERRARIKSPSGEVSIEDIYSEYKESEKHCDFLMNAELIMEEKHIHIKKSMYSFYTRCIAQNKNVYLVSDMYLPVNFIEHLLENCNVHGYKKLYVSCEHKKNKVTSELFRKLINDENIRRNELIHIGDSFKADFQGAHKIGISSVLIPRKNIIKEVEEKVKQKIRGL